MPLSHGRRNSPKPNWYAPWTYIVASYSMLLYTPNMCKWEKELFLVA